MPAPAGERILMISTHGYVSAEPEFGKPDTGGQVVYVLELSKCLARIGYNVDIMTRRFSNQPATERVSDNVRIMRFPCGGDAFIPKEVLCDSIAEWVENASGHIADGGLRYSLINSHYWDAGLAGQALADRFDIPHFHTPHSIGSWKRDNMDGSSEELETKYNFRKRIREETSVYEASDMLIATTPAQRDILSADEYQVPAKKIAVIPPGYDDRRFFPVSQATRDALKRKLNLNGRIVLALGRLAKNKGYDLLVHAMSPIVQRVNGAKLLLAIGSTQPSDGEVEQLNGLKEIANSLNLEDRVIFRDYIPDDLLADYYRAADVFALSSRYEPFGMTAVEAMACGTPTVITTEGGLWEQIRWGRDALYANPFDSDAFGHAIASVLQHREVSDQLAQYGSQKARAEFTWTGVAQQILKLLEATPSAFQHQLGQAEFASTDSEAGEAAWKQEACL